MMPPARHVFFAVGFWSVALGVGCYQLGRRACSTEAAALASCQAQLGEARIDAEGARIKQVEVEAVKCRALLKAQADLRCRICEASHAPAAPARPAP